MTFTDALPRLSPDAVLTFRQWCELVGVGGEQDRAMNFKEWVKAAGISEKSGRYLIESGDSPPIGATEPEPYRYPGLRSSRLARGSRPEGPRGRLQARLPRRASRLQRG